MHKAVLVTMTMGLGLSLTAEKLPPHPKVTGGGQLQTATTPFDRLPIQDLTAL